MSPSPPAFDDVVTAFQARERAIRYKVRDLKHAVVSEKTLGTTYRRLNVEATLYEPSAAHIVVSIWEDGSVWVTVGPSAAGKGWRLDHKIESTLEGLSAPEVIRNLERTVQRCRRVGGSGDPKRELTELWSPVRAAG